MQKLTGKIAGVVVAVALFVGVAVPAANALTVSEITALLVGAGIDAETAATLAAVLGEEESSSTAGSGDYCAVAAESSYTIGKTGASVVALQDILIDEGFLTIPAGVSKGYFGNLTKSALAQYQMQVMGVAGATGYYGPISQNHFSDMCQSDAGSDDDMDDDDNGSSAGLGGGEASLEDYDALSKYSSEDIQEGDSGFVFAAEFEVDEGDARIERIDLQLQSQDSSKEDEPWEQVEEITLYINGEEVDSKDVDDEDEWSDEDGSTSTLGDWYEVRFSGLSEVVEEGEDVEVSVEVHTSGSIDDSDLDLDWKVRIPANGIRAIDGEGIDQYTGSNSETKTFTIEAADDGDVTVSTSSDDPDAATIIVDEDDDSSEVEVFVFEIESEEADTLLTELTVQASTTDDDIEDVISEFMVEINGEEYDFDTASTTAGVGDYTFEFEDNDDDVLLEEDEQTEVIVRVVFNQQSGNYDDGTSVDFLVNTVIDHVLAEGEATGDTATVSGSAESEVHVLRIAGIVAEGVSESAEVQLNTDTTNNDDEGVYEFVIDITALDDDAWIPDSVGTSSSSGIVFSVTGDTYTAEGTTAFISEVDLNDENKTNSRYNLDENETGTFTVRIELDPNASGSYGVELETINFATTSSGSLVEYTVPNVGEFESKRISVNH